MKHPGFRENFRDGVKPNRVVRGLVNKERGPRFERRERTGQLGPVIPDVLNEFITTTVPSQTVGAMVVKFVVEIMQHPTKRRKEMRLLTADRIGMRKEQLMQPSGTTPGGANHKQVLESGHSEPSSGRRNACSSAKRSSDCSLQYWASAWLGSSKSASA